MISMFIALSCFGLSSMTIASDQSKQVDDNKYVPKRVDYAQQRRQEQATLAIVTNRLYDMLEATEDVAVYTEEPPKLIIRLNETDTVTATGSIARKAYAMLQHKKNPPSLEELSVMMQQSLNIKQFYDDKNV